MIQPDQETTFQRALKETPLETVDISYSPLFEPRLDFDEENELEGVATP